MSIAFFSNIAHKSEIRPKKSNISCLCSFFNHLDRSLQFLTMKNGEKSLHLDSRVTIFLYIFVKSLQKGLLW